jgi:plastocyanin
MTAVYGPVRWRLGCVTALLVVGLLSGCSPRAPEPPRAVPLETTEFSITPGEISAHVGDRLSFRVANMGVLEHNVSIKDPSGDEVALLSLLPNQHGTLQVELPVAGAWKIICTLPGHEMAGMVATLAVSP